MDDIQHLENKLNESLKDPDENPDETETVTLESSEKKKDKLPKFRPPAGRKRQNTSKADTGEIPVVKDSSSQYDPQPVLPVTGSDLMKALIPDIFITVGLLLLSLVCTPFAQGAVSVAFLLAAFAFVGWKFSSYDWVPTSTVIRTIEQAYGIHVIQLYRPYEETDPFYWSPLIDQFRHERRDKPSRVIHRNASYDFKYAKPGTPETHYVELILSRNGIVILDKSDILRR